MMKQVSAYEYEGNLYRTIYEVNCAKARKALNQAFKNPEGAQYTSLRDMRFEMVLREPGKLYYILKEIFN